MAPRGDGETSPRVGPSGRPGRLRTVSLLLLIAYVTTFFFGLAAFPLQEPDEGRYADIARAMATEGDLVTPHLNGIAYFEKPPLAFWLAAGSLRLFGLNEFAARFPFALSSLLTLLLVDHWSRRTAGNTAGAFAALILATMPLFSLLSRIVLVDVILTLFTTAALYCFHRHLDTSPPAGPSRRWRLAFWIAVALAFLTKGPIGLVIPTSSAFLYMVLSGSWRRLPLLLKWDGLLLFVGIAAPWYLLMALRNPEFLHEFFVEQNLGRLVEGSRFRRQKVVWYYLPVFVAGFLPWSLLVPGWLLGLFRGKGQEHPGRQHRLLLVSSVVAPLAIFSIAQSKLAYYLLPIAPPLALLTGDYLLEVLRTRKDMAGRMTLRARRFLLPISGLLLGILALSVLCPVTFSTVLEALIRPFHLDPPSTEVALHVTKSAIRVCLLALGLVALLVANRLRQGDLHGAMLSLMLGGLATLACAPWEAAAVAPLYSVKEVAVAIRENLRPGEEVLLFGHYLRGVPFYLQRDVVLWEARHAEFGHEVTLDEADGRALQMDESALRRLLGRALVVVDRGRDLEELEDLAPSFRMETLYRGYRYLLLRSSAPRPPE